MSATLSSVTDFIPQRPPFLFVEQILERGDNWIRTQQMFSGEEEFFRGHFPGNPIVPGVILCEAVFQTGALLAGQLTAPTHDQDPPQEPPLGVITRIESTKFKNFVRPKDPLIIEVTLKEKLGNAFFMKGNIRCHQLKVMSVEFACAMVSPPSPSSPSQVRESTHHE